jgi:hypothetical protein
MYYNLSVMKKLNTIQQSIYIIVLGLLSPHNCRKSVTCGSKKPIIKVKNERARNNI